MATTVTPSLNNTPGSSAWNRLVQLTRNASSKKPLAKRDGSPATSENDAQSRAHAAATRRPIRLRGPMTTSSHIYSSPQRPSDFEPSTTLGLSTDDTDSIEVCLCLVGDPPLPNGKCSLSRQFENTPTTRVPRSAPAKAKPLTAFWGARNGERISYPRAREDDAPFEYRPPAEVDMHKGSQHCSRNDKNNGSIPYAGRKIDLTPTLNGQTHASTMRSRNQSSSAPDSLAVKKSKSPTITAPSTKRNLFAAKPTVSGEANTQSISHGAMPGRQDFIPIRSNSSATVLHLQKPKVIGAVLKSAKMNSESEKALEEERGTIPTAEPDSAHLVTAPLSSQESATPSSSSLENEDYANTISKADFKGKAKRRLTFQSASYDLAGDSSGSERQLPPKKKPKTQIKKHIVQTTLALAIGGSTGMRECKVCDTVYNPFHPEDVKVHAKRHAGVMRLRTNAA